MEIQLPISKGKERNTLFFIGNGFDLFHELKTKFIHFYSWLNLNSKEHEQFVAEMESFFQAHGIHGNNLWKDFEDALGEINIKYIQEHYSGVEENSLYDEKYQKRAAQMFHETTCKIPLYLKEWISKLDISNVTPRLVLSEDCRYLSFNYTLLLESVYRIPQERILHIHHCYTDKEDLVTGHNKRFTKWPNHENDNIEKALQNISTEANALRKPVLDIIKQHSSFFQSLSDISTVIVFGHSLSDIDMPYFKEVLEHIKDNAEWLFIVYDDAAKTYYESKVKGLVDYLNDPHVYGVNKYKKKIAPESCKYIKVKEL